MPIFLAKRGTTMPPNMPDNHSEVFSHSSTLKMESTDGGIGVQSRIKRPRASIILGIVLLFLLAGISVAAGICYLNHMRTMNDISRWVDDGVVSPVSSTTAATAADGLGKRQQYSYGHQFPTNATSSVTATVHSISTTTATEIGTTVSTSGSFFETAPGIPVTMSPVKPSIGSTITQTVTSQGNNTVLPSVHSTLIPENVTVTVHVNNTITFSPSAATLSPVTNTLTVTSTGAVTETLTSNEVLTKTQTTRHNITVSVPRNTTVAESTTFSAVTLTVPGTVIPVPVSPTTVATAAGVTGAPPSWTTNSNGWNSTIFSSFASPTASNGTISVTVTATVNASTSCTESMGSTVTSNDAITATVIQSQSSPASSLTSSIVSPLDTIVIPTTVIPTLVNSTTTCTETVIPTLSQQLSSSTSEIFYTTETETIPLPKTTKTLTVTVVKSTSVSEPVNYSAKGVTTTVSEMTTSIVQATVTESLKPSSAGDTCAPVVTITITATTLETITAMSDPDRVTVKGVLSMMMSSQTPAFTHTANGEVMSASDIPLVSISSNTTVIVSVPHHETIFTSTKTIIEGMTTASTDAASASMAASHASDGLMSHTISDFSTSIVTATTSTFTHDTVGNGTTVNMQGTGTGISIIYSTQTVMGNHTSTGVPIVPVSAGSKRTAKPFGGGSTTGGTQTSSTGACIMMLVAIISLLV